MDKIIAEITHATEKLLGLAVSDIKKDYNLSLDFGDKKEFDATKRISKTEPDGTRLNGIRFFRHTRSEWELDLDGAWRIDKDGVPYCHYNDYEKIDEAMQFLIGKKLISITFASDYLDTQFHFENTITLHVYSVHTEMHEDVEEMNGPINTTSDVKSLLDAAEHNSIWTLCTPNNKRLLVYSDYYEWENIVDDGKRQVKLFRT